MSRSTAWVLVLLAAPASGLQAPGALRMHRGDSFAVASASRGAALTMQAGDGGAAVESKHSRVLRPLRSASTSVAATVLLALVGPRGAARAAVPLEAPTHSATTNSRSVENAAAPFSLRTLSPRRGTIDQMEEDLAESRGDAPAEIARDMEQLVGRGMGRQYMSRDLIFGEELTELTPLQEELDELDEYTSMNDGVVGKFKASFTYIASAGIVYGLVRILKVAEEFFITSEKKTMQEEMDLTGMFISIDAGEVEGAVDPNTGKNITIGGVDNLPKASDPSADADVPAAGARTRERGFPLAAPACDSPCTARSPPPNPPSAPAPSWLTLLPPVQARRRRRPPRRRRRRGCCACAASATRPARTTWSSGRISCRRRPKSRTRTNPSPLAPARPGARPPRARRVRKSRRMPMTQRASTPSRTCSAEPELGG
jgi:hypothetical protein